MSVLTRRKSCPLPAMISLLQYSAVTIFRIFEISLHAVQHVEIHYNMPVAPLQHLNASQSAGSYSLQAMGTCSLTEKSVAHLVP